MVPTPVGVSMPPSPLPPARMRSTSVPCGTRLTATFFAITCCCAVGLSPIWLAVMVATSEASNSFPMPRPGTAASLAMIVSSLFFCRTSSSRSRSGVPTPMKPPIMMVAPFGIIATASSAEMFFMSEDSVLAWHSTGATVRRRDRRALICIKGRVRRSDKLLWADLASLALCLALHADALQHSVPEIAHLPVALVDCSIHGVAVGQEVLALQKQDLRLDYPAAFKFDPPQRHHERIFRQRLVRQQRGG